MPHGPGHCPGVSNAARWSDSQCRVCWLVARGKNFAKAVVRHVAAGRPQATPEQQAARMALCLVCPEHDDGKCAKCGCGLKLKTAWLLEVCPLAKW